MPTESSIRFAVPARRKAAILRHPALRAGDSTPAPVSLVERTYFDTADLDLRERGISLYAPAGSRSARLTVETVVDERGWIALTKRTPLPGGRNPARARKEHSARGRGASFDASQMSLPEDYGGVPPGTQPLPLCSARLQHSTRVLSVSGVRVEAVLESGELRSHERSTPILDLVLSVRGHSPKALAALASLASSVQEQCALRVDPRGIAERAAQLLRSVPPPVAHARGFVLRHDMSAAAAFSDVLRQCIKLYRDNEKGVCEGEDPESVHQARVALRQLSSACSVFAGVIPKRVTAKLRKEVRWLARILGEVRDWEVLRTETFADAPSGMLDSAQLDAFDRALLTRIADARSRMRRALRTLRYARLQMFLTAWTASAPWPPLLDRRERAALAVPVRRCADAEIARRRKKLLKKGVHLARATPEERHRARIAAKGLRYAIDFLGSLYPEKPIGEYSRALKKVQDVLGALNDNRVARERLREMAAIPMTAAHPPIRSANLERHLRQQEGPLLDKLTGVWKRLREARPPHALPEPR